LSLTAKTVDQVKWLWKAEKCPCRQFRST